jgi:curved DNA-binding protein CbpA
LTPVSDKKLSDVLAAYGLLRNPDRRSDYDHTAERTRSTTPTPSPGCVGISAISHGRHATTSVRLGLV